MIDMPEYKKRDDIFINNIKLYILCNIGDYNTLLKNYNKKLTNYQKIEKRRELLKKELEKYGLCIRSDSKICDSYIYQNNDDLETGLQKTVNTSVLMNFLFNNTNYQKIIRTRKYDISESKSKAIEMFIKKNGESNIPDVVLECFRQVKKHEDVNCFW
jgi:hypothetical protein